jgi:hypothetical protein
VTVADRSRVCPIRPPNLTIPRKGDAYKISMIRRGSADMGSSTSTPPGNDRLTETEMEDLLIHLHAILLAPSH